MNKAISIIVIRSLYLLVVNLEWNMIHIIVPKIEQYQQILLLQGVKRLPGIPNESNQRAKIISYSNQITLRQERHMLMNNVQKQSIETKKEKLLSNLKDNDDCIKQYVWQ